MDLKTACHVFMAAYWRSFETGVTVERSGYIVGGVDIADAVEAVVDAAKDDYARIAERENSRTGSYIANQIRKATP